MMSTEQNETLWDETAYRLLENAALLNRCSADDPIAFVGDNDQALKQLDQMSQDAKVRLVTAACDHALPFSLPAHFTRLLKTECLEPEEIEEVEHVLCQIDGLDAVISFAADLVQGALESNDELLVKLAQTRCVVAKLVDQLSVRPDIVSVASRLVLAQRQPRYLDDGRPADWFTRFRAWDREPSFEEIAEGVV